MTFGGFAQAAFAVAVATLASSPVRADFNDDKPINYTVDGATATGYFKVVTEAINGLVRETYPGSAATYKPGSPAGGILNISRGQSDFTFNGGATEIGYALDGKAPFTESLKGKFNFVMLLHQGLVVHSLMTKEWAERNGIRSFADIAAKKPQMRLAVNQLANLQSTVSMYISLFDAYGIKEEEVARSGGSVFRSNSAGGLEALRDGKIDVFINGGFLPTAEIADVARGTAAALDCRRAGQDQGGRRPLDQQRDRGAQGGLSVRDRGRSFDRAVERHRRRRPCLRGDGLQIRQGDGAEPAAGAVHPSLARSIRDRQGVRQPDAAIAIILARRAIIARPAC